MNILQTAIQQISTFAPFTTASCEGAPSYSNANSTCKTNHSKGLRVLGISGDNDVVGYDAFPERVSRVPLTPEMDLNRNFGIYKWGAVSRPKEQISGSRSNTEFADNKSHEASQYPWPINSNIFHPNLNPENDRINTQYAEMVSDILPEGGFDNKPVYNYPWEKMIAYHYGLYRPEEYKGVLSEDEIRVKVNDFAEKVNIDNPKSACKYLQIEEYKCLLAQQAHMDVNGACMKCMKWFNEWRQCMWDEEKMNKGYNYMESIISKKHKPYIATPNFQYS